MGRTNTTTSLIIVLLLLLLAYVGAVVGVFIGWSREQLGLWLAVGALVGILIGAVLSLALARRAKPERHKPNASNQPKASPPQIVHEAQLTVHQAFTKDNIPLELDLYLAFGSAQQEGDQSTEAGPNTDRSRVTNLVTAAATAATTQTVIQRTVGEAFAPEASNALAQSILEAANPILAQWEQEIRFLIIKNIKLPDELNTARIALWIEAKQAEIDEQIKAVRIQTLHKQIKVLERTYVQAKDMKKGKVCSLVLARVLQDTKSQAAPEGIWPDTLEELLSRITGFEVTDEASVGASVG